MKRNCAAVLYLALALSATVQPSAFAQACGGPNQPPCSIIISNTPASPWYDQIAAGADSAMNYLDSIVGRVWPSIRTYVQNALSGSLGVLGYYNPVKVADTVYTNTYNASVQNMRTGNAAVFAELSADEIYNSIAQAQANSLFSGQQATQSDITYTQNILSAVGQSNTEALQLDTNTAVNNAETARDAAQTMDITQDIQKEQAKQLAAVAKLSSVNTDALKKISTQLYRQTIIQTSLHSDNLSARYDRQFQNLMLARTTKALNRENVRRDIENDDAANRLLGMSSQAALIP